MTDTHTVVWQQWGNVGLEYPALTQNDHNTQVDSVVIGFEENIPFRMHYQIHCDAYYQVQRVTFDLVGEEAITLTTDGAGHRFDKDNQRLPSIDGCMDIDISATPFTNTLPVRRLDWQAGQSRSLDMVYIRIPELTIERVTQ